MKKEIMVDGLFYLEIKGNKIRFTTDTPDFKDISIDEILEELYNKFNITNFEINIHVHKGKKHDKDIIITIKDGIEEVADFILNNFYNKR